MWFPKGDVSITVTSGAGALSHPIQISIGALHSGNLGVVAIACFPITCPSVLLFLPPQSRALVTTPQRVPREGLHINSGDKETQRQRLGNPFPEMGCWLSALLSFPSHPSS